MFDITKPFIIYANCTIHYDGRASSVLQPGNYLIIYKQDQALTIHGSNKVTPLNYQSPGTKIIFNNNIITATRKTEVITIHIHTMLHYITPHEWSNHQIQITKTEQELVNKLIQNIDNHFNNIINIQTEYSTPYGPIDILIQNDIYNIIEVKRKKITLNNCYQLEKYLKHFQEQNWPCQGYLAGPEIAENAQKHLEKTNCRYIQINF